MFDAKQYESLILLPVLESLQMYSQEAVTLMLGTLATESLGGTYLKQESGPALGVFQMEPATHDDIWKCYLPMQTIITHRLMMVCRLTMRPVAQDLISNLLYATAMARIHYWRVKEPIPKDIEGQAAYWKKYYNVCGKGTEAKFLKDFKVFTGGDNGRTKVSNKGKV